MTDIGVETRLVDVSGRQIVVRKLQDAQLVLLAREARVMQDDISDNGRKLKAVGRIMDILESAVVQQEDREYLMDLNVAGKLTLTQMRGFIDVFGEEQKTTVRRGRRPAIK